MLIKSGLRKQIDDDTINMLAGCFMKKLTKKYSPEKLASLAEYEFNDVEKDIYTECIKELDIKAEGL